MNESLLALCILAVAALAGATGYWIGSGNAPVFENVQYRVLARQQDDSVIAERAPQAQPSKPPHKIPKGSTVERHISTQIAPAAPGDVRVDLSLVRDADGGRRAVVSSPHGRVLHALDVPVLPAVMVTAQRSTWAAGLTYNVSRDAFGLWAERDFGRLRIGADLTDAGDGSVEALVRAGVTFR